MCIYRYINAAICVSVFLCQYPGLVCARITHHPRIGPAPRTTGGSVVATQSLRSPRSAGRSSSRPADMRVSPQCARTRAHVCYRKWHTDIKHFSNFFLRFFGLLLYETLTQSIEKPATLATRTVETRRPDPAWRPGLPCPRRSTRLARCQCRSARTPS